MKLTEIPYMYLSVSSLCWLSQAFGPRLEGRFYLTLPEAQRLAAEATSGIAPLKAHVVVGG